VNPPFDQYAKLCGARGYAATAPGETAAAVANALAAGGPAVVHVQVDPAGFFSLRKDLFGGKKE
ncbi:MAG: thiamine pyrophosphate-binding protein, partial [Gammaproteobacteria bacterium]|nr:thiamine pyrophosphate-binding protein [Gammaproteobacteria bacterium]